MKMKTLYYMMAAVLLGLTACHEPQRIDPSQKEKEMLEASSPEEYEYDGDICLDYTRADKQPLKDWVLNDTATLSYPFTESVKNEYVTVATSTDGNLRIYTWDTGEGGTMICWGNIIQYRDGKRVRSFDKSLGAVLHPDDSDELEMDFGSHVDTILTVPTQDGSAIYLIDDYFRESSNWGYSSLIALKIEDGKLMETPVFTRNGETDSQIGTEHTIADWYFITNLGDGWDWIFRYDTANNNLYSCTVDSNSCYTDQYDIYHFDGKKFSYAGTDGPYWLYSELREYECLELLFETEKFLIRVDRMKNGGLRYASWSHGTPMSEKPDLVLTDGKKTEDMFKFTNGKYAYNIYRKETENELEIMNRGKVILKEIQKAKQY